MRNVLFLILGALFLVRLDVWFWDDASLVLGVPVGLAYHVGICMAAAVLMLLITRLAWPDHLDGSDSQETAP